MNPSINPLINPFINLSINPFIDPSALSIPDAPEEDPLGLRAWGAAYDLGPHTALAVVSAVLANIAGPVFALPQVPSQRHAPGINLAGVAGDHLLDMAVTDLVTPLKLRQTALLLRAREYTAAELEAAMLQHSPNSRTTESLKHLADPEDVRDGTIIEPQDHLPKDLEVSTKSIRYEAMVRPGFLIPGAPPANPAKVLAGCHLGFGFATGTEVLPAGGPQRNRRIDELLKCLRGIEISRSTSKRSTVVNETVWLRGIFLLSQPDFDWLVGERRDFLSQAIPVSSGPASPSAVDEYLVENFRRRFGRAAVLALGRRRGYACAEGRFRTDDAIMEFLRRQRQFLRELQKVADEYRVHELAGLPAAMAWALLRLAGKQDLDAHILATVFDAARQLQTEAVFLFRTHEQAAVTGQRLDIAHKLVQRLTRLGPSKRRLLVRGFDQQCLAIYEPVIRVLLETGIFCEGPDRVLRVGQVPVARLARNNFLELP